MRTRLTVLVVALGLALATVPTRASTEVERVVIAILGGMQCSL